MGTRFEGTERARTPGQGATATPPARPSAGASDFLAAVQQGDVIRVRALLAADPALVGARTSEGLSPILVAAFHRRGAVLEELLAQTPELTVFEAAATGRVETLVALLRNAPEEVRACSPDGFGPLTLAAYFGHEDAVDVLLVHGANPRECARNEMRVQPIHSACAHADADAALAVARRLLEAGSDARARQAGGWTPLHAAAHEGRLELARLLLRHGADPTARNEAGVTPIEIAMARGHLAVFETLRAAAGLD